MVVRVPLIGSLFFTMVFYRERLVIYTDSPVCTYLHMTWVNIGMKTCKCGYIYTSLDPERRSQFFCLPQIMISYLIVTFVFSNSIEPQNFLPVSILDILTFYIYNQCCSMFTRENAVSKPTLWYVSHVMEAHVKFTWVCLHSKFLQYSMCVKDKRPLPVQILEGFLGARFVWAYAWTPQGKKN